MRHRPLSTRGARWGAPSRVPFVLIALALAGCSGSSGAHKVKACTAPPPPAAALAPMDGKPYLLPDGRALTPTGTQTTLGGFPVQVIAHPTLPVAYVANTGYAKRSLELVSFDSGKVIQDLPRSEGFYGLALSPDGKRLYASGGYTGMLEVYDVAADGTLTASSQLDVGRYPGGIAVSPDGSTLWVTSYLDKAVKEIDASALTVTRKIPLSRRAYAVVYLPGRDELYVSGFGDTDLSVVDLAQGKEVASVKVGANPLGLAAAADGSRVYATVTDQDVVVSIDTKSRKVDGSVFVGEPDIAGEDNTPLPASSPSGIALDEKSGRLYVTRAADNAVAVLDASNLKTLGAIPVGWYPTDVALSGKKLVVTNAKGIGTGPLLHYGGNGDESGKKAMQGTLSLVDLPAIDLPKLTAQVEANVRRPSTVYPFDCKGGEFPVPTTSGGKTPIEHIVLIVRENKTYDTVLGDLGTGNGDPALAMFGKKITPNLHKLASMFANHDNFYDDSECSVQGHLWLTSSFVNDYMERTWIENYRGHGGDFPDQDAAIERGQPQFGTFFTHLMKYDVDFTDFGEVVGSFGQYAGMTVLSHVDTHFPGVYFNLDYKDEDKAKEVATQLVDNGNFPPFSYVLLPNDHTKGTGANDLTPQAMINDNDYATGLLVDRISHSKYWKHTAIFLVEDDPQMGADHVEYHRSILLVISPWAKHHYTSSVHLSYPSLFRSFELILGLPPMNREDALATPVYDAFTMKPDYTPYDALPRSVADTTNGAGAAGAAWSALMDFRGPDRNPDLRDVLWWAMKGSPPKGSHIAYQLAHHRPPSVQRGPGDPDDQLDEAGWQALRRYLARHPEIHADLRPRPAAPPGADDD